MTSPFSNTAPPNPQPPKAQPQGPEIPGSVPHSVPQGVSKGVSKSVSEGVSKSVSEGVSQSRKVRRFPRLLDGTAVALRADGEWSDGDATAREIISQIENVLDDYELSDQYFPDPSPPLASPPLASQGGGSAGRAGLIHHIEVEGRLGVIVDEHTRERLKLPSETEMLLCNSDEDFRYRFDASLSRNHFEALHRKILKVLRLPTSDPSDGSASADRCPLSRELRMDTRDVFVPIPPNYLGLKLADASGDVSGGGAANGSTRREQPRARISLAIANAGGEGGGGGGGEKVVEGIIKKRHCVMNVYSGTDNNEDEVALLMNEASAERDGALSSSAVDFRVSVNCEITLPDAECGHLQTQAANVDCGGGGRFEAPRSFQRVRHRVSYPLFGSYRLDLTEVDTHDNNAGPSRGGRFGDRAGDRRGAKKSYEIEIEINPHLLYYHYKKKRHGDPSHKFDAIVVNFLKILRNLTAFLNSNGTSELLAMRGAGKGGEGDSLAAAAFGADLRPTAVPPESLEIYLKYFSPVVPIIGDYAFRCVAPALVDAPEKFRLTEEDRQDSLRQWLTDTELRALLKKKTQYLKGL